MKPAELQQTRTSFDRDLKALSVPPGAPGGQGIIPRLATQIGILSSVSRAVCTVRSLAAFQDLFRPFRRLPCRLLGPKKASCDRWWRLDAAIRRVSRASGSCDFFICIVAEFTMLYDDLGTSQKRRIFSMCCQVGGAPSLRHFLSQ